jgi:hypothetical protein
MSDNPVAMSGLMRSIRIANSNQANEASPLHNAARRDIRRDVPDDEDVEPDRRMHQAHLHQMVVMIANRSTPAPRSGRKSSSG